MNTSKQINAMVVVLFVMLVAVGAYAIWDPFRSGSAEDKQTIQAAERGAGTFALNCRLCHGDRGQGGVAGGRLPAAPALDRPDLRGIKDGAFNQPAYDDAYRLVTNTITCGRVGTAMPTWGQSQGGFLNTEQVRQLAVLITKGKWEYAQEHADEADTVATEHATIQMPDGSLTSTGTELVVSNAGPFTTGQFLRIQDERLRVRRNELEVQRGANGTAPAAHETGTIIVRPGEDVSETAVEQLRHPGPAVEPAEALREAVDAAATVLIVNSIKTFAAGDTLQLDDEQVRVTGLVTGIPTTGQRLAEDIGRTPHEFLVSGAEGLEVGSIVRIEGELMEVVEIRDNGETGIALDEAVSASAGRISVSDATFFHRGYVLRVDGEPLEVAGPVETRQTLDEAVGRAQTTLSVSGTAGIEAGTVIRMGRELIRVTEIVQPAQVEIERGADGTQTAAHAAGADVLRPPEQTADKNAPPAQPQETGQTLTAAINADDTTVTLSGVGGISADGTYQIGAELVHVVTVQPAVLRVERGVQDTKRASHARRSAIYLGNLIEVKRGAGGAQAAAHEDGAPVLMTEVAVKREVAGSKLSEHAKNTELYLGNQLVVQRAALGTQAADHANATPVLNFPAPPDSPAITQQACGQIFTGGTDGGGGATPIPNAPDIAVSLREFSVAASPATVVGGAANFQVTNAGTAIHNFRVIRTDLAPDALPIAGTRVDEESSDLSVVGGFTSPFQPGTTQVAPVEALEPGAYVLICNVPGHYQNGMHLAFQVTAP